jgi:hypothetical protein
MDFIEAVPTAPLYLAEPQPDLKRRLFLKHARPSKFAISSRELCMAKIVLVRTSGTHNSRKNHRS